MYQKPGGGLKDRANRLRLAHEQEQQQAAIERAQREARNREAMFAIGKGGIKAAPKSGWDAEGHFVTGGVAI